MLQGLAGLFIQPFMEVTQNTATNQLHSKKGGVSVGYASNYLYLAASLYDVNADHYRCSAETRAIMVSDEKDPTTGSRAAPFYFSWSAAGEAKLSGGLTTVSGGIEVAGNLEEIARVAVGVQFLGNFEEDQKTVRLGMGISQIN